jgi:hypothetical protein
MSRPEPTPLHESAIDPLASFADLGEIVRALAYAELRAIMLAWAHVPARHPAELVRSALDQIILEVSTAGTRDFPLPNVGQRLRDEIRAETATAFRAAIAKAAPAHWSRSLAPGQLGDADGLEVVFHEAGEAAGRVRGDDARTLSTAVALTEYVRARRRARLDQLASTP